MLNKILNSKFIEKIYYLVQHDFWNKIILNIIVFLTHVYALDTLKKETFTDYIIKRINENDVFFQHASMGCAIHNSLHMLDVRTNHYKKVHKI